MPKILHGASTIPFLQHRKQESSRVWIRSFAIFAASTTIIIILHGLYISAIFWATLRFLNGITSFGLFMVVESWLNECTQSQTRGRVFSIYMTLTYMGIGIGQQLLNFGGEDGRNLFLIAALLFSLSLIPVSATRSVHPELPQPTRYNFKALFQKVPIGMLGCFSAGGAGQFCTHEEHVISCNGAGSPDGC